ncbi:MAG: molybdenum cofactor guanylyltransferase [Chthoniobacterales bacterium]
MSFDSASTGRYQRSVQERETITMAGIILAGGASSRMHFPKHSLLINGVTMLERQVRLLRLARVDSFFVSVAKEGQVPKKYPLLIDKYPDLGPLGAIATALETVKATHFLVLAVDLPDLTPELLLRLRNKCTEVSGSVPMRMNGDLEPLCAIYPATGASLVLQRIAKNACSVKGFVEELIAAEQMNPHELTAEEEALLRNVNYPQDL